jgi:hypothetical protein
MASRESILDALRSAAAENGGRPPGVRTFQSSTGITLAALQRVGFARYGDAVAAAGLAPNDLTAPKDSKTMMQELAALTRTLRRFPTISDLRAARATRSTLPSLEAYLRLSGRSWATLRQMLVAHCRNSQTDADLSAFVKDEAKDQTDGAPDSKSARVRGFVYLARHGQDYKIGRSNDVTRRRRELALLLPQELKHVHVIETDDPEGIERYWHQRFEARRVRGEWFRLTPEDIRAFKRRRYQ